MAVAVKKKEVKTGGKRRHGRIPSKRTINFAGMGEKPVRPVLAIPSIILIIAAALVFSKFFVLDRLNEVSEAQRVVSELQHQVDACYEELGEYGDLVDAYAHYTYSGFTTEELNRASRPAILNLLRTTVLPWAKISSWSISGNTLSINLRGESLQQINLIVQQLNAHEMVDYCTVNTANARDNTRARTTANGLVPENTANTTNNTNNSTNQQDYDIVNGTIQVYLNNSTGVRTA